MLLILGFLVGNLVLSVGTSVAVENVKMLEDQTSGNPDQQLEISVNQEEGAALKKEDWLAYCDKLTEYGEVQLLSLEPVSTSGKEQTCTIVPVNFKQEESWHVPLLQGRYFHESEIQDTKGQIILGKNIAEKNQVETGSDFRIGDHTYEVIGICGRENRPTQWDDVAYMPWKDYWDTAGKNTEINEMNLILKNGKSRFLEDFEKQKEQLQKQGMILAYQEIQGVEKDSVGNSILLTIIASGLVFLIAIINLSNLMIYWMMERKKDLAVFKAMGAGNHYIVKNILAEVMAMIFISAVIAILVQWGINRWAGSWLAENDIYTTIGTANVIAGLACTALCGVLAALVPAKFAMRVETAECLKE